MRTPRPVALVECAIYIASLRQLEPHHEDWLDETETGRRSRFRNPGDRDRFTLGAALVRALAGRRSGQRPAAVTVDRRCPECGEPHGRPQLPADSLQVSVSHSGDLVALAATTAGPVGIDVEADTTPDHGQLLATVCAPQERRFVHGPADFLAYWTRKEAVLKATGQGLRIPMTSVVVTPPTDVPRLVSLRDEPPPPCRMTVLALPDGYAGAAAVLTDVAIRFEVVATEPLLTRVSG